ncbi:MAG: OmpA family protein [Opitutales bacterium]|jgi:peptidoglycan-associated lipoprotein
MSKLSKLSLALLIALPILAGCSSMQPPTAEETKTSAGTGLTSPTSGEGEGLNPLNSSDIPADLRHEMDTSTVPPEDILCTVYFDFNQYNIRADQRATLEAASKTLAGDSSQKVVAVGYTDWYGSDQYNLALGDRRANSVKTYATQIGAADSQIETLSEGKLNAPTGVAKDSPEAQHSRRVDLVKLPPGGSTSAAAPSTP